MSGRPAPKYRIIVQRATTREIITRDAPLDRDDLSHALSAVGSATFTTTPAIAEGTDSAGGRIYQKWNTLIALEQDGQIRWRGILTDITMQGATRTLTVDTMGTYPHGIPYDGDPWYAAKVDPADIMRKIWAHVQSYRVPFSDLRVSVVGSTGLSVGTESTAKLNDALAAYRAANDAWHAQVATKKDTAAAEAAARDVYSDRVAAVSQASKALVAAKAVKPKNQAGIDSAQRAYNSAVAARDAQRDVVDGKAAADDAQAARVEAARIANGKAYDAKVAANKAKKDDGGSYDLLWWEAPDCGSTIDTLASDNGFDWTERHRWNADKSDIITEIVVAYPRAGTRRTDLVFEQGVNITTVVEVTDSGDDYANVALGIGAGEGEAAIRRSTAQSDGALRRVTVLSAKDVKSAPAMDKRLGKVLTTKNRTIEIAAIEVEDSITTPIGSWSLGDDIRVDAYIPHLRQRLALWHRVTGWSLDKTGRKATISLKRSSAYTYGG